MKKTAFAAALALVALAWALGSVGTAHGQSSLGIGTNEAPLPSTGLFAGLLGWINAQQQSFYRSLTAAMKTMRDTGQGSWVLVALSFVYGVFHAAGPGHGKAVISSYMLANEVTLRRGILLSFASALLQAVTAIAVMTLAFLVLRGTAVSMTDAAWFLEIVSYAAVAAFGAWLLWRKAGSLLRRRAAGRPALSLSAAAVDRRSEAVLGSAASHRHGHDRGTGHRHYDEAGHGHDHGHGAHPPAGGKGHEFHGRGERDVQSAHQHSHAHGPGDVCAGCGHAHAPDPAALAGPRFDWRTAATAIAAVGIRPCSGALIVLTFAFLNGLRAAGVLSVLAMALGTAITVSVLATLAVTAKNVAVAFAGGGRAGTAIHSAIEIAGAAFLLLVGLALLAASLAA